jgi:hypothetical protein
LSGRQRVSEQPIFVHTWWRSGSTYVWSKLRENKSCRCYYEPLHERIASLNLTVIKADPDIKLSRALKHPIPKKHYFAEYAKPLRSGNLGYFPDLAYDRYLLQPAQTDERLRNYLDGLISSANAANRRAVLCFCRSQMRSAWMKQNFGGFHVAQIRNPADQWASFKIDSYFISKMILIALRLRDSYPRAFVHIPPFEAFAQQVAKRSSLPAEVFAQYFVQPFVNQRDCLDIFLVIWMASALQAVAYCDFLLDIDLLSADVEYRTGTMRWFDSIGCHVDFSDCSSPNSGDNGAALPALQRTAADAAKAIRTEASSLIVTEAEIVRIRLPSLSPLSRRVLSLALGSE